jgi:hypothetical protein
VVGKISDATFVGEDIELEQIVFKYPDVNIERQCLFVQFTLIQPESEGAEDGGILIVQSDYLFLCFGKSIVESSLEVGRRVAEKFLVYAERLGARAGADDDLGSGASNGISERKQSVQSSVKMSCCGISRPMELIGIYRSDILEQR